MKKILFCSLAATVLLFASTSAAATQQSKHYRVGLSVWSGYPESVRGFKDALAEGGLIEGENIEFLERQSGGDKQRQRAIAEGFKSDRLDLVYSLTTPGTSIVKEILPADLPIVFSIVTYPADSGLIESFEYSGNNLVGTSNYVPLRHYLKLLKTIMPYARTVAIFHRKGEPNSKIQAANLIRILKNAGIEALDREPTSIAEVRSMALSLAGTVDVFMSTTDTLMQGGGEAALIEVSLAEGIPILSSNKSGIERGSTFGPVADFYTLGKLSGEKALLILRDNMSPSDIESELQDPPLTLVNRRSLKALGLSVPEHLADKVQWAEPG